MAKGYSSRFDKIGAPRWARGLALAMLALILLGNLAAITFSWSHHNDAYKLAVLTFLWALASIDLFFLVRLWMAQVGGRGAPEGP